jgi:hypothetical protein
MEVVNDTNRSFTPITTFQGLSSKDLINIVQDKELIIWGCGHLGKVLKKTIEKQGIRTHFFCDKASVLQDTLIDNMRVLSPEAALKKARSEQAVIIIASSQYRDDIESLCTSSGLVLKQHYLLYLNISRPEAIINIISESKEGSFEQKFISLSNYKSSVKKLLKDIPHLSHINLSLRTDALHHPNLPEIIEFTERFVPCTVTTHLTTVNNLAAVLNANPSQFVVSIHFSQDQRQSPSLDLLCKNLEMLSSLARKHATTTDIKVMYHLYKNNQVEPKNMLSKLCDKLKLKFVTAVGYIEPYDKILELITTATLSSTDEELKQSLAWDFEKALHLAELDNNLACLCQRLFPVIQADLSVAQCELYQQNIISEDFLSLSLEELLLKRHTNEFCKTCQSHSLHRLDIDVVNRRHNR